MREQYKIITYFSCCLLGFSALLFSNYDSYAQPLSYSSYSNETFGIEMDYPSDWDVLTENLFEDADRMTSIVLFHSGLDNYEDLWNDGVSVIFDDVPYRADVSEYLDEQKDFYSTLKNFHLVSSATDASLGGLPAYKLTYTNTYEEDEDLHLKNTEIGTIVDGDVIYIELSATTERYPELLPVYDKMIESFKLVGSGTSTSGEAVNESGDGGIDIATDSETIVPKTDRTFPKFQGIR